jgi:class 3 adenylate cyclase
MAQRPFNSLIIFLDIEKYSRRPDSVAAELRESLYRMTDCALAEAGLAQDEPVIEDRGDGMLILLPRTGPVEVLGGFLRELETEVRHRAKSRASGYELRLRVAIHSGFVWHDGKGWVGGAINMAARLVNSGAVRGVLDDHTAAHVAVIISDDLYRGVVAQGHAALEADTYRESRVVGQDVDAPAWTRIPSGTAGGPPPQPESAPRGEPADERDPGTPAGGISAVHAQEIGGVYTAPVRAESLIGIQHQAPAQHPGRADR